MDRSKLAARASDITVSIAGLAALLWLWQTAPFPQSPWVELLRLQQAKNGCLLILGIWFLLRHRSLRLRFTAILSLIAVLVGLASAGNLLLTPHKGAPTLHRELALPLANSLARHLERINAERGRQAVLRELKRIEKALDIPDLYLLSADGAILNDPLAFALRPRLFSIAKSRKVDTAPIEHYLRQSGDSIQEIPGEDPVNWGTRRWGRFTAARLMLGGDPAYLYIVLPGLRYRLAKRPELRKWLLFPLVQRLLLLLAPAALGAWLLSRAASGRLEDVLAGAERIAGGDVSFRLPASGKDEIADLARAVNEHAESLQRAAQRTAQAGLMRSSMLADISHDLNTPLACIEGYLRRLSSPDVSLSREQIEKFAAIVELNLEQTAKLAAELKQLSQLEGESPSPDVSRFCLRSLLVEEVLPRREEFARSAGVNLRLEADSEEYAVLADHGMIERALTNLIENAVRYNRRGGEAAVRLRKEPGAVRVEVADNGPGIAREDQQYIFERYYRGRAGSGDVSGSGLGLSIVKTVLEAHGSEIELQSTPGEGAVFSFFLPANGTVES